MTDESSTAPETQNPEERSDVEKEEDKAADDAGVRHGLEALGHRDEMGRLRIKWDSLINFIGDLLKGFGYDVDVTDQEALGRAMDDARERASKSQDQMMQIRHDLEVSEAKVAELTGENAELAAALSDAKAKIAELEKANADLTEQMNARIAELTAQLEALKSEHAAQLDALKTEHDGKLADLRVELEADLTQKLAAAQEEKTAALAEKDALIEKYILKISELESEVERYKGFSLEEMESVKLENEELAKRVRDMEDAMGVDDPRRELADLKTETRHLKEEIADKDWALDQFNVTPEPDLDSIQSALEKLKAAGVPAETADLLAALAGTHKEKYDALLLDMNAGKGSYATVTDLILEANQLAGIEEALLSIVG